jgi:hypothetical protein
VVVIVSQFLLEIDVRVLISGFDPTGTFDDSIDGIIIIGWAVVVVVRMVVSLTDGGSFVCGTSRGNAVEVGIQSIIINNNNDRIINTIILLFPMDGVIMVGLPIPEGRSD